MSTRRPHPYDEDYAPAASPWLTFVSLAEARASTKPLDPELLSALLERCRKEE